LDVDMGFKPICVCGRCGHRLDRATRYNPCPRCGSTFFRVKYEKPVLILPKPGKP
jgi:DNA-directed RNA polymerase subunit RPC12/RpoP